MTWWWWKNNEKGQTLKKWPRIWFRKAGVGSSLCSLWWRHINYGNNPKPQYIYVHHGGRSLLVSVKGLCREEPQAVNILEQKVLMASLCICCWHLYSDQRKTLSIPTLAHMGKVLPTSNGSYTIVLDVSTSKIHIQSGLPHSLFIQSRFPRLPTYPICFVVPFIIYNSIETILRSFHTVLQMSKSSLMLAIPRDNTASHSRNEFAWLWCYEDTD